MRALIVEDDAGVAALNKLLLEREGLTVDVAGTAREGERLARENDYSAVLLDMRLPDGDGFSVLSVIRERNAMAGVLVLTGDGAIATTIAALEAGADDCLQKPYDSPALSARIRALLRRYLLSESSPLACGNIIMNRIERFANVGGVELALTVKEFALLEHFIINREKRLTRKDLLKKVWRIDFDPGTNMLDVHVSRLREKLYPLGAQYHIHAARGVGYIFTQEKEASVAPAQ